MNKRSLEKQERDLKKELAVVRAELVKAYKRARVRCAAPRGCGKLVPVSKLTYIQTHWYTRPYGCTGGDYWTPGEGRFVCPRCGTENRLYDRPDVVALKPYFKGICKTHER